MSSEIKPKAADPYHGWPPLTATKPTTWVQKCLTAGYEGRLQVTLPPTLYCQRAWAIKSGGDKPPPEEFFKKCLAECAFARRLERTFYLP